MRRWKAFPALIGALGALVLGAAAADAQPRPIPGAGGRPRPPLGGAPAAPDARVARHPGTGLVTFLPGDAGAAPAGPALAAPATAEGAARAFVAANATSFGIADAGAELRLTREDASPAGGSVVRYRQLVGGVPVFGGEVHVAVGADRRVRWASAETIAAGPLSLEPALAPEGARAAALAATAAKYALPESAFAAGEPALEVYDEVVFDPARRSPGLVWRVEVTAAVRPVRELVLVDARRGGVRLAFNQIDAAKARATHTMNNSENEGDLPGLLVCSGTDAACEGATADADVRAAHRYAGDTYDYFSAVLGRDGIDGAGMVMISSTHFGTGYQNAFWNGEQMVYGDGFAAADDVVGHELAHGVMQYTANLYYWAESGAINESYSDLHGEFVDQRNLLGSDGAGDAWLMGEDVPGFGAIRNMADPTAFDQPDRIGSANYYTGLDDNAGVHTNSGVNNKAVWLMAAGGSFNGQSVASLGNDKVAWLYYTVQAGGCLTEAANFNDLANCLRSTCDGLAAEPAAGQPTFTTADCTAVRKAITAVQMDARPGQRFLDDANAKLAFKGGGWAEYAAGFGDYFLYDTIHESTLTGDSATMKFSGSRLAVHTYWCGTGGGTLDLFLDSTDKKIGSINQATNCAGSLYLKDLPSSGTHKLIMKHAKGSWVSVDAVASSAKAVATPADGAEGFADLWGYYPWETSYLTYKGAWFVWPGSLSWSNKTGDSVSFTFTGNAFTVFYGADYSDLDLGRLQVFRDGKLVATINQREGYGDYYMPFSGFPRGKHTVTLKHYSGPWVNIEGFGAYDLTLP